MNRQEGEEGQGGRARRTGMKVTLVSAALIRLRAWPSFSNASSIPAMLSIVSASAAMAASL